MSRHVTRRGVLLGGLAVTGAAAGTGLFGWSRAWALESPRILGCDEWGAVEPSSPIVVHDRRPARILVHHTASPNVTDYGSEQAVRLARDIQAHHRSRQWIDSGQHFTISRGGIVLEGRHRSVEMLRGGRRMVEGAHCTGQNVIAIGIESEGTYTRARPPDVLWNRLREMCAFVCQQYRVRPTEIYGHRDYKDTACPGDLLYGMLPELRGEVATLLREDAGDVEAQREADWPLLRVADRGADVQAAQYLLRSAGHDGVVADGRFDRRTADAVRRFQQDNETEEVNGMIGGESWPLLVAPASTTPTRESARALRVITPTGQRATNENVAGWRRLLRQEAERNGR